MSVLELMRIVRESNDDVEIGEAILAYMEQHHLAIKDCSSLTRLSETAIIAFRAIGRLHPDTKRAYARLGKRYTRRDLLKVARMKDPAQQVAALLQLKPTVKKRSRYVPLPRV